MVQSICVGSLQGNFGEELENRHASNNAFKYISKKL